MANGSPAFERVVVIGAGVMGSGIAAHLANLGRQVSLLDIPPSSLTDDEQARGATLTDVDVRLRVVRSLWDRAKNARPPHFYLPDTANNVRLGNVEDHLDWVRDADWVVEAVLEKMDVKRDLYAKLDPLLKPDTLITTNTSGLRISELAEGRSESFRKRFVGTHFFNPPRYLKLLEIIPTPESDPSVVEQVVTASEDEWAKRVVVARDTPGFIANRIGMFCIVQAVHAALETGLTIEEVDALTGPLLGRPRTGTFRLHDLIGLDIVEDVAGNQYRRLTHDRYRDLLQLPEPMKRMLADGRLGNKSGQGFYKREGKAFLTLDLTTMSYREAIEPRIEGIADISKAPWGERLNRLLLRDDRAGEFLRKHLVTSLTYALYCTPEISDTLLGVDRVMRWGFGWELGPFEMVDAIGIKPFVDFVGAQGLSVPPLLAEVHDAGLTGFYHKERGETAYYDMPSKQMTILADDPRYVVLADLKAKTSPVFETKDTSLLDLGDNVLCLEFHTKMNALTPEMPHAVIEAVRRAEADRKALVLGNEGRGFSCGFDLRTFLDLMEAQNWTRMEQILRDLQAASKALRYSTAPTVAAIHGFSLGGGLELPMHCARIVAAPETSIGLPEVTVGVIPAAGGTTTMALRNPGLEQRLGAFKLVAKGEKSANADEARRMGYLEARDLTCYNADQLLFAAKQLVRQTCEPRRYAPIPGLGPQFRDAVSQWMDAESAAGNLLEHDLVMAQAVAAVMASDGEVLTEEEMLEREREQFLSVVQNKRSSDRTRHMLDTGKPLRN